MWCIAAAWYLCAICVVYGHAPVFVWFVVYDHDVAFAIYTIAVVGCLSVMIMVWGFERHQDAAL